LSHSNVVVVTVVVVVVVVDNILQRLWATHIYFAACAFKTNKKNNTKKIGDNPRNDSNNSKKHTYPIDTEREKDIDEERERKRLPYQQHAQYRQRGRVQESE